MAVRRCGRTVDKPVSAAYTTYHSAIIPGWCDARVHALAARPRRAVRRSGLGDHVHGQFEHHAAHQLDPHIVLAHRLDRLVEDQVPPIDDGPGLLLDMAHDVGRGHRAEQPVAGGTRRDGDHVAHQGAGHRLGSFAVAGVAKIPRPSHGRGLALDAGAGHDGLAGREQMVAGEPTGDIDDVAALAHAVDVTAQQDLHPACPSSATTPSTTTISSPSSSSTTSTSITSTSSTGSAATTSGSS